MSTEKEPAACDTPNEAERLKVLERQVRELAEKTRSQQSGSLETRRRLEELTREAQKQKKDVVSMLANFKGSSTQGDEKKNSSERTRDEQSPEASSDCIGEETFGSSS